MTDAKPVEHALCPRCNDGEFPCDCGGVGRVEPSAKPVDVGALVARAIEYHAKMHKINSEICGKFWDVGAAAEAQEHADFHQALLALQAEVAQARTAVNDLHRGYEITFNDLNNRLNALEADRDRLTQENARLAKKLAGDEARFRQYPNG